MLITICLGIIDQFKDSRRNHVFFLVSILNIDVVQRLVADAPAAVVERRDVRSIVHVRQPVVHPVFGDSRYSAADTLRFVVFTA